MDFHEFRLSNGLRFIYLPWQGSVCHTALVIGAGSRDEGLGAHGVAHFTEHVLFKGTSKRKMYHILNHLDSVGGELNAYTSREETWIHGSVPGEFLERSFDIIADITLNSTFPDKEVEKEREVIIDEINSYEDQPGEMVFEKFDEVVFGKHSLGRSILGTPQSLENIGRNEIIDFTRRHYQPSISVLAAVGQATPSKALEMAEKYFGSWEESGVNLKRRKPKVRLNAHVVKNREAHQAHLVIGGEALSWYHPDNRILALIMNYLGGPSLNSRLSYVLREKHGIGYHAEANYQPYTDSGYFSFYVGTDRKNVDRCRKIIESEIRDLQGGRLKGNLLREIRRQMKGQIVMARESGGAVVNYLAKSTLIHGRVETPEEIFRELDAITEKDVVRVSREVFRPGDFNSVEFY